MECFCIISMWVCNPISSVHVFTTVHVVRAVYRLVGQLGCVRTIALSFDLSLCFEVRYSPVLSVGHCSPLLMASSHKLTNPFARTATSLQCSPDQGSGQQKCWGFQFPPFLMKIVKFIFFRLARIMLRRAFKMTKIPFNEDCMANTMEKK